MQSITLDQLRTATMAGGVTTVTLEGQGAGFFVKIITRNKQEVLLAKARTNEPRHFGSPASALKLLRNIGIVVANVDTSNWNPEAKDMTRSRQSRSDALKNAHEAAAYNEWLALEIQDAIDDPRPSVSHDEVMTRMASRIAEHMKLTD